MIVNYDKLNQNKKVFMKSIFIIGLSLILMTGCSSNIEQDGFDEDNMDNSVKPGDNFFRYVNGGWLKKTEIPEDKSRWGNFDELREENLKKVRDIMQKARNKDAEEGTKYQKIGHFYETGMNVEKVNSQGYEPIKDELESINKLQDKEDIQKKIAQMHNKGISPLFAFYGRTDNLNSKMIISWLSQGGLGLPDKSYYLEDEGKNPEIRKKYVSHIANMFELIEYSEEEAGKVSETIMEIETRLAKSSMDKDKRRNPNAVTHKYELKKLDSEISPDYNWNKYFARMGFDEPGEINVAQPEFFKEVSAMMQSVSVEDWKEYLKWNLVNSAADYLSDDFVQENFEFYGKVLNGIEEIKPRWKRVTGTINSGLNFLVGKLYIEEHFPENAKHRMEALVDNLQKSYRERLKNLDWMSEGTKETALEKLDSLKTKIAYPDEWRDFEELEIEKDTYFGNVLRARRFNVQYNLDKINKPKDPKEWHMTPQTVNAYFNPTNNEMVFPAAILQPPFFNIDADKPVNYGSIGAVIGHEMTHGFDDQGRKYGPDGNLESWWTEEDKERFEEKAEVLKEQYSKYTVLDSLHMNAELTAGENIADLGGLKIAQQALQKAMNKDLKKDTEGFSPLQKFFLGFGQVWRAKIRDEALAKKIKTDPHPFAKFRVNGTVRNMDSFYNAFDISESDSLYLDKEKRASIW